MRPRARAYAYATHACARARARVPRRFDVVNRTNPLGVNPYCQAIRSVRLARPGACVRAPARARLRACARGVGGKVARRLLYISHLDILLPFFNVPV